MSASPTTYPLGGILAEFRPGLRTDIKNISERRRVAPTACRAVNSFGSLAAARQPAARAAGNITNSEDRAQRAPLSASWPRRCIHRKARRAAAKPPTDSKSRQFVNATRVIFSTRLKPRPTKRKSERRAAALPFRKRFPTENVGTKKARKRSACPTLNSRFPQPCVVLRIFDRADPRYHCPFSYDDKNDTIVRHSGSTDQSLPATAGGADLASESASPRL